MALARFSSRQAAHEELIEDEREFVYCCDVCIQLKIDVIQEFPDKTAFLFGRLDLTTSHVCGVGALSELALDEDDIDSK